MKTQQIVKQIAKKNVELYKEARDEWYYSFIEIQSGIGEAETIPRQ